MVMNKKIFSIEKQTFVLYQMIFEYGHSIAFYFIVLRIALSENVHTNVDVK